LSRASRAHHDVVIVGGGIVGATLACALAEQGLEVALVEARGAPPPPPGPRFDARVSALTRASERLLQALGAWQAIAPARIGPFREMHVWDAAGVGEIHFDSAEIGEPLLGHIVENSVLQRSLETRLASDERVSWHRPATVAGLAVADDGVAVELAAAGEGHPGGPLSARLVVGADGSESRVRALAGIGAGVRDYRQKAVVAVVRSARAHGETAWQRFLPEGPLALLPLPANHSAVVWSTTPERARALGEMPPERFARELEQAFESRLGAIELAGHRAAFPLRRLHAERYVAERVALVGDAAHTIHPLAGQGVNLGLLDAGALAEVVADARDRGRDFARPLTLRRYERWRRGHNLAMQAVMDSFHLLFANRFPPARAVRNLGLAATDRVEPLKRLIMRHASGLAGDLPRLARSA